MHVASYQATHVATLQKVKMFTLTYWLLLASYSVYKAISNDVII